MTIQARNMENQAVRSGAEAPTGNPMKCRGHQMNFCRRNMRAHMMAAPSPKKNHRPAGSDVAVMVVA